MFVGGADRVETVVVDDAPLTGPSFTTALDEPGAFTLEVPGGLAAHTHSRASARFRLGYTDPSRLYRVPDGGSAQLHSMRIAGRFDEAERTGPLPPALAKAPRTARRVKNHPGSLARTERATLRHLSIQSMELEPFELESLPGLRHVSMSFDPRTRAIYGIDTFLPGAQALFERWMRTIPPSLEVLEINVAPPTILRMLPPKLKVLRIRCADWGRTLGQPFFAPAEGLGVLPRSLEQFHLDHCPATMHATIRFASVSPSFEEFAEQLIDTAGLRALTLPSFDRRALEFIVARLVELPRLESLHIWSDESSATTLAGRAWTGAPMLETLQLTGVQIHGDIEGDYPALRTIEIEDAPYSEAMHDAWVRAAPHARIHWRRDELGSAIEAADRFVVRPTASCWHWWPPGLDPQPTVATEAESVQILIDALGAAAEAPSTPGFQCGTVDLYQGNEFVGSLAPGPSCQLFRAGGKIWRLEADVAADVCNVIWGR
ncbi:MAG: hypothetical protein B7733_23140 [Myxococcales bacterium FL481]|nr:MAG: hypothetical protein B7733_23140 [Myxococcales bacterium FL481]